MEGLPSDELLTCQKIITYFYAGLILVLMEGLPRPIDMAKDDNSCVF